MEPARRRITPQGQCTGTAAAPPGKRREFSGGRWRCLDAGPHRRAWSPGVRCARAGVLLRRGVDGLALGGAVTSLPARAAPPGSPSSRSGSVGSGAPGSVSMASAVSNGSVSGADSASVGARSHGQRDCQSLAGADADAWSQQRHGWGGVFTGGTARHAARARCTATDVPAQALAGSEGGVSRSGCGDSACRLREGTVQAPGLPASAERAHARLGQRGAQGCASTTATTTP
mmetsp:Transcript_50240/g.95963  ORF Transcript_50240/g.95963 Transcript_50240/m.95963 type:complete len:231 (-) Transcript_50240:642-1334(-)